MDQNHQNQLPTWGTSKTLADYFKESAAWQGSSMATSASIHNNTTTTSMPWAAAVKSPPDHAANNFDYNNTIGSWSSPETSTSNRGGWNTDGSTKNDGVFDDGTAIWGNPTTKKTGVDWTDKESLINPPQAVKSGSSDKRTQKPEPTIGSINGTEAWGAPVRSSISSIINSNNVNGISITSNSSIQQQSKNDNSGNTYGTKSVDGALGWGEAATVAAAAAAASSSSLQAATNENSSPPNHSVWNNLAINKQKSSDWLASSNSNVIGCNATAISRLDELNKQLESTSLFDSVSTMTKASSSNNHHNHNLDLGHHSMGVSLGGGNSIANSIGGGNFMNDLKQISANYSNDLLESLNRQPSLGGGPSGNSSNNNNINNNNNNNNNTNSSSASNNNTNNNNNNQHQSQQLESAYNSSAATPSRDLLKQMVHQIQLAVQAGHLNAHILNQPMSTPTLQLVYQLLQQIKTLHQLQEIQQRANIKSDPSSPSNMDLQINRIRQNISLLQKAITQQQAALTKNEAIGDSNINKQQANSHSYATISKLSTNFTQPATQAAAPVSAASANYSSSAIGGLSLQSNPWMFASGTSSLSMRGVIGGNNMAVGNNKNHGVNEGNSLNNKSDNDNADKIVGSDSLFMKTNNASNIVGGDSLFMKTNNAANMVGGDSLFMKANNTGNIQRSSSALYGWSDLASSLNESNQMKQQQQQQQQHQHQHQQHIGPGVSSNIIGSARPAPPPGLMSNFGSLIGTPASSVNGISLLDSPKLAKNSHDEAQVSNREPLSSLWSGTWFD